MHIVSTVNLVSNDPKEKINASIVTMFVDFPASLKAQADRIEVWGTNINDDGPDYTEFRLMKDDRILAKQIVSGY